MSKDVVIQRVARVNGAWVIAGLVESRSRPGYWHSVEVRIRWRGGRIIISGRCDCEAFTRGHMACRHILHLTNVFIRNRGRFIKAKATGG